VPGVPAGTYFVLACANATNAFPEGNLGDQCRATAGTVSSSGANLVETGVSNPPQRANIGGTFSISEGVLNNGSAGTNTGSTTYFYLSLDGVSPSSTVAGSRTTGTIGAGSTSSGTTTLVVPRNTAKGSYKVLACADRLGQVPELSEKDNCSASTASIAINGPDLRVSSVSVSAITATTFNVTDKTSNPVNVAPAAASQTGFYLSTDTTLSSDDLPIHDCSVSGARSLRAVPSLTAGASNTATTTLPKCYYDASGVHPLPTGSYRVLACADVPDAIPELNENNNCLASSAVTF
jgi:subtilase family serine protease